MMANNVQGIVPKAARGDSSVGEASPTRLRITEIFHSLQGEALTSGWPTVFVRLTGCPLRCTYCDTAYAFSGGEWYTGPDILAAVREHGARHVCVTGGEPLAQPDCIPLMELLCDAGLEVSLETSGALDISPVDPRVSRIVDIKTPDSGEAGRNRMANLDVLRPRDGLKFVLCSRSDYDWAKAFLAARTEVPCTVLFSPSSGVVPAGDLADWILADGLNVRLQVQLHKLLWGDVPGR